MISEGINNAMEVLIILHFLPSSPVKSSQRRRDLKKTLILNLRMDLSP